MFNERNLIEAANKYPRVGYDFVQVLGNYDYMRGLNNARGITMDATMHYAMMRAMGKIRQLEELSGLFIAQKNLTEEEVESVLDEILLWASDNSDI